MTKKSKKSKATQGATSTPPRTAPAPSTASASSTPGTPSAPSAPSTAPAPPTPGTPITAPAPGAATPAKRAAAAAPKAASASVSAAAPRVLGPSESFGDKLARTPLRLKWLALGAIVLAWALGFGLRAEWETGSKQIPSSIHLGKRLLTTADAYYYAAGVKLATEGGPLEDNGRVPGLGDSVVVSVGAGLVEVLGVDVEDLALWLPAVLAPLAAVPLVLLGLMFGQLLWGLLAGAVVALGYSYWNRTVPGYFDTDMITITYVVAVTSLVVAAFWRRTPWLGTLAGLLAVTAPYMHPGSERVLAAVTLGAFGYAAVFARKEPRAYRVALAMAVAYLPLPGWLRAILLVAVELGLRYVDVHVAGVRAPEPGAAPGKAAVKVPLWSLVALSGVLLAVVVATNDAMDLVLGTLGIHFGGGEGIGGNAGHGVSFMGLGETVAELANPSLDKLGDRIAGSTAMLVTGIVGYLLACWRYRPLLMFLPLLALGTVKAASGQRYTIFAVPVVALGNAWLLMTIGRLVARFWKSRPRLAELGTAALLSPLIIGPAVVHGLAYPPRTSIGAFEAAQLTALSSRIKPGDFVMSWWDYSYSIWYFADARTLVDGMKQTADVWVPSEMLFSASQREAASLARIAAEEQVLHDPFTDVVHPILRRWNAEGHASLDFVPALREGRATLPPKTREVYFYIPWKFLSIAGNVARLRVAKGLVPDGEVPKNPFIIVSFAGRRSNWTFDAANKVVVGPRGERVKVWKTVEVKNDNGRVVSRDNVLDEREGKVAVIEARHVGVTLLVDRNMYATNAIQLLVLAKPDTSYFEPVSYTNGGVVYRVKL